MTMQVKIIKEHNDSWQARVRAIDTYAEQPGGEPVAHTSDLGVLKKAGEEFSAYCTSTRRLEIVEENLEATS